MRGHLAWFYGFGIVVSSSWLSNGAIFAKENILKLFIQFKHYKKNKYACMNATTLEHINLKWLDMTNFYHIKFN